MKTKHIKIILIAFALIFMNTRILPAKNTKKNCEKEITKITSKGRLIVDYENKIAEFFDNVKVEDKNGTMQSDYLKIIFSNDGLRISKMIASGNVVIRHRNRTAYSKSAVYIVQTEVLRLIGNPKIIEKGNTYTADEITILVKQNKVLFEPSARIIIQNPPKNKKTNEIKANTFN